MDREQDIKIRFNWKYGLEGESMEGKAREMMGLWNNA
jgi:hypothetical protein